MRLQAAAHAPPPAFEAIVRTNDTIYVLIRCHGDGASQAAIDLLGDVSAVLNPAFGTDLTDFASAFVFDADESLSVREATFASEYTALFQSLPAPKHGKWVKGFHRVGLYVFHNPDTQKGTLEDLLAPLVEAEWSTRWHGADAYLKTHAQPSDPGRIRTSEWLKAQINVTGQFLFPGDPMSVVIGRPMVAKPGLPDSHFKGVESQTLVSFLQEVPW